MAYRCLFFKSAVWERAGGVEGGGGGESKIAVKLLVSRDLMVCEWGFYDKLSAASEMGKSFLHQALTTMVSHGFIRGHIQFRNVVGSLYDKAFMHQNRFLFDVCKKLKICTPLALPLYLHLILYSVATETSLKSQSFASQKMTIKT